MTQTQLTALITTVGLGLFSAVVVFAITLLRKKIADVTATIKNETIRKYVAIATDAVLQAVQYTAQTFVDGLKASGQFTEEKQNEAFEKAKATAISMITEEAVNVIDEAYGDFSVWLDTKIEQLVKATK